MGSTELSGASTTYHRHPCPISQQNKLRSAYNHIFDLHVESVTYKEGEGLLVLGHLLFGEGISLEGAMVSEVQKNSETPHCGGLFSPTQLIS